LERAPERRYQHASEVKTDVETITRGGSPARLAGSSAGAPVATAGSIRDEVKPPAVGLIVCGAVNLVFFLLLAALILVRLFTGLSGRQTGSVGFGVGVMELMIVSVPVVLTAASSVLVIIGARHMLGLQSYALALTSCIVGMLPFGFGWLVGLPAGIWGLIILNRPGVKAAFGNGIRADAPTTTTLSGSSPAPTQSGSQPSAPPPPVPAVGAAPEAAHSSIPRFSGKAILGAFWALAFFVAAVLFFAPLTSSRVVVMPTGLFQQTPYVVPSLVGGFTDNLLSAVGRMIALVVLLAGAVAPVATTVLGIVSLRDVRYSRGRIVGLPLALFDAVFFPLLILDAIVIGSCAFLATLILRLVDPGIAGIGAPDLVLTIAVGVGLFLALLIDLYLIRVAWRAARRPVFQG
jgi:hypothetical protein